MKNTTFVAEFKAINNIHQKDNYENWNNDLLVVR